MRRNRLQGFTVVEVTVAMLLTGLIALLAYGALGYVQRSYDDYRELTRRSEEHVLFHTRLQREVMEAEELLKTPEGVRLVLGKGRTLTYEEGSGLVRRMKGRVDSFALEGLELEGRWRGERKNEGLIDELVVSFQWYGQELFFRARKRPDAVTLMKGGDGDRS